MLVYTRDYETRALRAFSIDTDDHVLAIKIVKEEVPTATVPILAVIQGGLAEVKPEQELA